MYMFVCAFWEIGGHIYAGNVSVQAAKPTKLPVTRRDQQ